MRSCLTHVFYLSCIYYLIKSIPEINKLKKKEKEKR